jgi:hypothetical protein
VTPLEQLVAFVAAKTRWGLHPFKVFLALLLPVLLLWLADWWLRHRAPMEPTAPGTAVKLPRIRRRP